MLPNVYPVIHNQIWGLTKIIVTVTKIAQKFLDAVPGTTAVLLDRILPIL